MRIFVVELEPTHYKTDLWNAFVEIARADVTVAYCERKNWSPDGGHDYQQFPTSFFQSVVFEGKGYIGALRSALRMLSLVMKSAPRLTYIAGYAHLQTVLVIAYCIAAQKRFTVFADVLNNGRPSGRMAWLKWGFREGLRKLIFRYADAVLVCGRVGVAAARDAGCRPEKIQNFPYSVSLSRIRSDQPLRIPVLCSADLDAGSTVFFFSGRMIPRKGLRTLLQALADGRFNVDWVLWIEGAGPELEELTRLADYLGIARKCRFLGFCQYDLHSWLVRSADIVVVPSIQDNWGIVVDEGLQLGKAVISTSATGSAVDRIIDGVNGFIIPPDDPGVLTQRLECLINDITFREKLGQAAASSPKNIRPQDNVATLMEVQSRI